VDISAHSDWHSNVSLSKCVSARRWSWWFGQQEDKIARNIIKVTFLGQWRTAVHENAVRIFVHHLTSQPSLQYYQECNHVVVCTHAGCEWDSYQLYWLWPSMSSYPLVVIGQTYFDVSHIVCKFILTTAHHWIILTWVDSGSLVWLGVLAEVWNVYSHFSTGSLAARFSAAAATFKEHPHSHSCCTSAHKPSKLRLSLCVVVHVCLLHVFYTLWIAGCVVLVFG